MRLILITAGLTLALVAGTSSAREQPGRLISAGEHVAERNCAECHALRGAGPSPLPDAPPFSVLRGRFSRDAMAEVIRMRMEVIHPRMPKLALDVDEIDEFLDYWDKIKPAHSVRNHPPHRRAAAH